jgi:hypothetical protein
VHFKLTKFVAVLFRCSPGELATSSRGESVVFCFLADGGEPAGEPAEEPAEEPVGDGPKSNSFRFFGVVVCDDPLVL